MKPIILTILFSFFSLSLYPQGNYVFENKAFNCLSKIEIAKKHKIKSISYYPKYKDSLKIGKCEKKEIYDTNGNILKVVNSPNSRKEYKEYSFVYNNNYRLKEVNYFLSKRDKQPFHIISLDYYPTGQLKSMTKMHPHGSSIPDTLFYYYTKEGRYDYKVWGKSLNRKMFIRYNKCNEIEYVETSPYKLESIQLDSNDCITYSEMEMGEDFIGDKNDYERLTCNDNCQITSYYGVYNFGNEWNISDNTIEYDKNYNLIRITKRECKAKTKAKCEKELDVKSIKEFEYNDKGLEVFSKTKDKTGKLINTTYIKYEYY